MEDKKLTQDVLRESTARDCEIKNFYRAKTEQIELENRQALSRAPKFYVANFSSVCEFLNLLGCWIHILMRFQHAWLSVDTELLFL